MQMGLLLGQKRLGARSEGLGLWALESRRVGVRTVQRRAARPTAPGSRTSLQSSRTFCCCMFP